ncbi:MAG: alpha-glucan family phosphorylase [Myxococcota bacterium]
MRARLRQLADNLWWCWDTRATRLFAGLHAERWEEVGHNPIALLDELPDDVIEARAAGSIDAVEARAQAYLSATDTWAAKNLPTLPGPVAYFSMEFALHESLPIYSGGLGVLAGDHMKSASDLGIPFVGVGLLYREGYFKQVIAHGKQVVAYPPLPLEQTPLRPLDVVVEVPHGHHTYRAAVWELKVGRARLLLLDSDVEGNGAEHRSLCSQLYGGDESTRIAQEVLLGIGGVRALRAVGVRPSVFHMNEGHCAFAIIERWREEMNGGLAPAAALEAARKTCVFTTHTPVQAGHDRFHWDLKKEVLGGLREEMGLPEGAFMNLGRVSPGDLQEPLCMTVLAIRGSRAANGVSALHGEVTRQMWKDLFPGVPVDRVPIGSVTNGVHAPSWMHPAVQDLFDEHCPAWRDGDDGGIERIPAARLWDLRNVLRAELVDYARRQVGRGWLDPNALAIGFARRFAPYKRGNLLFADPPRLQRILSDATRPVQILFAGKAHPRDAAGQGIIRDVIRWTRDERFRGRVVFLPDYDMAVARRLVQGVDVWLNNPRRPREASGTSGMKVPLNLGVNLSVLDGWWPEIYDGTNGWAIGEAREYATVEEQDAADAESLYTLLEREVVPSFYERGDDGLPAAWITRMRRSLLTCHRQFHTDRMVGEYARKYYVVG